MEDFFDQFYKLRESHTPGALNLEISRDQLKAYGDSVLEGTKLGFTPIFYRQTGSKPMDHMTDSFATSTVSEHFVNILRDNHITGWDVIPIELHGKDGEIIPGYYRLFVTGRCGPVDDSQSPLVWVEPASPEFGRYQTRFGYFFDPKTWDRSDIFSPRKTRHIFVAKKVADLLKREKITNVRFESISAIERT